MSDRLSRLEQLRDTLWESIQTVDADKRAPLSNQYRAVLNELEELSKDAGKTGDPVDEISARRAARGGSTARSGRA